MNEQEKTKPASARNNRTCEQQRSNSGTEGFSRRTFLGVGSAGLAGAALVSLAVNAQYKTSTQKAEHDHSSSNPGQENRGPSCFESELEHPSADRPRRCWTPLVLLRSGKEACRRRGLDTPGDATRIAFFTGHRRPQYAPDRRKLP